MNFFQCQFRAQTLGKVVQCSVLMPNNAKPPFVTMYLLHGLSDDFSAWMRWTRIESYAQQWPLMIVMPDGFRGFYTDNDNGPAYATYMVEDVVGFIDRSFPTKTKARCISGLSMGGYGAFRLALAYPELFRSATSHSGALMVGTQNYTKDTDQEKRLIFGKRPAGTAHDLVHLATMARDNNNLPHMQFDCGNEDFLVQQNQHFSEALGEMGIKHTYDEFPGSHNWDYWDEHITRSIEFHARNLKLRKLA